MPYTWSITSGSLPPGLSLTSGGVLSGKPTTANTYSLTIRCTGANGLHADKSYSLTVNAVPTASKPSISSVSPNPITANAANSYQTLTINGSNFVNKPTLVLTWTGQSGFTLPASQVTYISNSQLTMSIHLGASADSWTVKAINPDTQSSNAFGFQVLAPSGTSGCSFPNTYPYPAANIYNPSNPSDSSTIDPWNFYNRECTSYAAWKLNNAAGTTTAPYFFSNHMLGGHFGDAGNWSANAATLGYTVNSTPAVGAIAQWNAGEPGGGSAGHVAYVEAVNSDGTVAVSEYNYHLDHKFDVRCTVTAPRFLHIHDASTAPDTKPDQFKFTAQTGVALNTPVTSNMITVSGITAAAPITITGGDTYSINSGAYTSAAGTVNNGDTVTVRQTSSGSYSSITNATLTIGGVSGTFSVTTQAVDKTSPKVTITSPTSNPTYSTSSSPLSIVGTASDNVGVTQVTWSNNRGGSGTCSGTTSWSASGITLYSGQNVITVTAWDAANNTKTDTLTVAYTQSESNVPGVSVKHPQPGETSPAAYCGLNQYFKNGYGGQCTAFCWGRAKEKLDVNLPHWGDAYTWYSAAQSSYQTGSDAQPNSIAVWSYTYIDNGKTTTVGHVAFVEDVIGNKVILNEANVNTYKDTNWGGGYDGVNGRGVAGPKTNFTTTSMTSRIFFKHHYVLLGYIYLKQPKTSVSINLSLPQSLSDTTPPTISAFSVKPKSVVLGSPFTISYTVSDTGGSGLNRVVLWRATDVNRDGEPNWPNDPNGYIDIRQLSGKTSYSISFSDTPSSAGTYWYGIDVNDNNGNWNNENNSETNGVPSDFGPNGKVTVTSP
jgi:surface antigen